MVVFPIALNVANAYMNASRVLEQQLFAVLNIAQKECENTINIISRRKLNVRKTAIYRRTLTTKSEGFK